MLKEIVIAIQSYIEAHQFIVKHRLWKWILIPGILYAIMFGTSMYYFGKIATAVINYLTHTTGFDRWLQTFQNSWLGFFFAFAGVILWLVQIMFCFSIFKYIFLIIGSPIFAYLSDKTEAIQEGTDLPFNARKFFGEAWRGIKLALRNAIWQSVYLFTLLLLCFIPIIGWVTPLIAIFIECYYYGFSMLDYSLARRKLSPQRSIKLIGEHRGLAIGNGLMFYLIHFLILVGWVVAPAYAIVAATLSLYKTEKS